jgi:plasmid stability protein
MVATLNIKNLPDDIYEELKARAKRERRSVAQEVVFLMAAALELAGRDLRCRLAKSDAFGNSDHTNKIKPLDFSKDIIKAGR